MDKIQKVDNNSIGSLSGVINIAFQIIYVLHKPYAKEKNFIEFMDSFEFNVFQNSETMTDITGVFGLLFPSTKEEVKPTK